MSANLSSEKEAKRQELDQSAAMEEELSTLGIGYRMTPVSEIVFTRNIFLDALDRMYSTDRNKRLSLITRLPIFSKQYETIFLQDMFNITVPLNIVMHHLVPFMVKPRYVMRMSMVEMNMSGMTVKYIMATYFVMAKEDGSLMLVDGVDGKRMHKKTSNMMTFETIPFQADTMKILEDIHASGSGFYVSITDTSNEIQRRFWVTVFNLYAGCLWERLGNKNFHFLC